MKVIGCCDTVDKDLKKLARENKKEVKLPNGEYCSDHVPLTAILQLEMGRVETAQSMLWGESVRMSSILRRWKPMETY